ncbi:MAG: hypothetical protein C0506_02690 [Anaerolinea sp.]|nr:hypothetical protein [Anaerolinea sp.]
MTPAPALPSHQSILLELALLVNERTSVAEVFAAFAERLLAATRFEYTALATVEPDARYIRVAGRHPVWEGSMPAGTVLRLLDMPPEWREAGIEGVEYLPGPGDPEAARRPYDRGFRHCWVANLQVEGASLGFLTVARRTVEATSAEELGFLRAAARLLAAAVRQDRLLLQAEQEAAQGQLLHELAVLLHAGEPMEALFDRMLLLIEQTIQLDYVSLSASTAHGTYRMVGSRPVLHYAVGEEYTSDVAQADNVFAAEGAILEYRTMGNEGHWPALHHGAGIERVLTAGLRSGDERLGFISIGRAANFAFTPGDRRFMAQLAVMLSQAEANRRHVEQIAASAARERILNELTVLLNAGEPIEALFDRLLALLERALEFDYIGLLALSDRPGMLRMVGSRPELVRPAGTEVDEETAMLRQLAGRPGVFQYRTSRQPSLSSQVLAREGITRAIAVALRAAGEPVGMFSLGRRRDARFSPAEVEFVEVLATILGQAVGNQRRLRAARADAARSGLLNEAALLVNSGEPPERLFDRLRELLQGALPFTHMALLLPEDGGARLRVGGSLRSRILKPGASFSTSSLFTSGGEGDGRLVHQYRSEEVGTELAREAALSGVVRVAAAVLKDSEQLLGVFTLGRPEDAAFDQDEMELLELLATLLRQALTNERRLQQSRAESARNRLLSEVAVLLNAGEPIETVFHVVVELLKPIVPWDRAALLGTNEAGTAFQRACSVPGEVLAPGEEIGVAPVLEALGRGPSVRFRLSAIPLPQARRYVEAGGDWLLGTALRKRRQLLGALALIRNDDEPFTDEEAQFVEVLATLLAEAVANQRRMESASAEAEEQRLIAAIAAAAAAETDPGALVAAMSEPLRSLIPRPFLAFGYVDGDEVVFPVPDGTEVRRALAGPLRVALEQGEIHARELPEDLDPSHPLVHFGLHASALTLAVSGGRPIGLLLTGSRQEGYAFGRRELRIFRLIAQIIGPAMENARASRRARIEAEEQRILAEVATIAAHEEEPFAVLQGLVEPLRGLVSRAFIGYGHVSGDSVIYTVSPNEELPLPMSPMEARARDHGQVVAGAAELPPDHPAHRWDLAQISLTPVWSGGVVTGLLNVSSRDPAFVFGERELRLLREIARIVGPAIEAARAATSVGRQSALYDLILRSLNEGVVLLDSESRTRFENAFGSAVLGAIDPSRATTGVEEISTLLPSRFRDEFLAALREGIPARGRAPLEMAGEQRWVDYELIPLNDDRFRLLFVTSDVTESVRREEEMEQHRDQMEQASRLAALGELIGGVAHELNNPLTAILGFADILAHAPAASELSEEVTIIQKEALRARNIVRDLLFIARPGPVDQAEVSLVDVVAHIERLRRAAWTQQGATVTIEMAPEGCAVWGNEHQLTQVLLNLVTNAEYAIKDRDPRTIRISTTRQSGEVEIVVEDTGVGMRPEVAERVFEPFFTTKHGSGTGLGLSLSYSIIQAHEGRVAVESRPGRGTRFRVTLPAYTDGASNRPPELPLAKARAARVLVVDDEPSLRKVCQRLIQSMGHECEVADSSTAALAFAASQDFDLILCDYRLATETADTVISGLVTVAPHLIRRTIIATGATTDPGVLELAGRHGLTLIAKPYGAEELAEIIAAAQRRATAGA